MQLTKRLVLGIVAFLFSVVLALPQDTATIVGTVSDPTGAVIPGASVTVSNPARGFTRHLITDSAGVYQATALPLGDFAVTVEASGFQQTVMSGIHLEVGQIRRVDVSLRIGQATQKVEVVGNIPQVQTETAALSDTVTSTQTQGLELNGRNFVQLATLVPGAVVDNSFNPTAVGVASQNNISFDGSPLRTNNWEIDGGNNTDQGNGQSFTTFPSLDSVAEFRVSTSNYGADQGRNLGAEIEVATKSGTKDFHGDLYEYNRNDKFDANNFFLNREINPPGGNAPKEPLIWNDFGWTLGGPVYIPNHYNQDKSKTFFFFSEEWRRYREGTVVSGGVPTARERTGDFSECDPTSSNYNPVAASGCTLPKNPATGQLFPGDIVPRDPNGLDLLNAFFPLPNNGVDKYTAAPSLPENWREEQIRVDQNISKTTSVFVRYTQDAWDQTFVPSLWTGATYDTVTTPFVGPSKSAVLHLASTLRPTLLNEMVFAFSENHLSLSSAVGASSVAKSIDKPSNWTANVVYAGNRTDPLLPNLSVSGGIPFSGNETFSFGGPWHNSNPVTTLKDNLAWLRGNHSVKTGFYLENFQKNEQTGDEISGALSFNTSGSNTTGNGLADMYLGRIQSYYEAGYIKNGVSVGGNPEPAYRAWDFEPYIMDTWKVRRNLTVTAGLRVSFDGQMHDANRPTLFTAFLPNQYNPALVAQLNAQGQFIPGTGYDDTTYGNGLWACGSGGVAKGCRASYWPGWGPRLGFSWDPFGKGKTVIRGGYGLYWDAGNGNEVSTENMGVNPPAIQSSNSYNITGYQNIVAGALTPASLSYMPYNQRFANAQQFSLGVQHQFTTNDLVTVSYVGNLGRDLSSEADFDQVPNGATTMNVPALAGTQGCDSAGNCNVQQILMNNLEPKLFFSPYKAFGSITAHVYGFTSNYNSLQASYRHTLAHGLTFGAAYTWSHALDNGASPFWTSGVDDSNRARWYGTSDINRTQVLMMNFVYQLPFFRNASNHFLRSGIGGWEFSGITSMFTGEPVFFTCGVNGFSSGIGKSVMCNSSGSVKIQKSTFDDPQFGPTEMWYDPNTTTQPLESQLPSNGEPGMFGNLGRNVLTGPGRNNWDLALHKEFKLPWWSKEGSTLQFRWETFNSFNHTQWNGFNSGCSGAPNTDGTPAFGRPCGGTQYNLGNGEVNSAWDPRIMQFALKLIF
jgi:hypothetical protein